MGPELSVGKLRSIARITHRAPSHFWDVFISFLTSDRSRNSCKNEDQGAQKFHRRIFIPSRILGGVEQKSKPPAGLAGSQGSSCYAPTPKASRSFLAKFLCFP